MRKPKKLQPEPFDVGEFLRPTDTDLRSALNSLLHGQSSSQPEPEGGVELGPGLSVVPDYVPAARIDVLPEVELPPDLKSEAAASVGEARTLEPPLKLAERLTQLDAGLTLGDPPTLAPAPKLSTPTPLPSPKQRPPLATKPPLTLQPDLNLEAAPQKRQFAVRPARLVEDGHSRAEQQVYTSLWDNATPHDEISRLITLGFASMGKLTGLSESNARINLRSLIQKLALDEHTTYNCAESQGRTYRIYHPAEILRRRHQAGLSWVMRRTLAVVFVDPQTKLPLFSKTGSKPASGLNLSSSLILINTVRGQLQQYGPVDGDTIHRLIDLCQSHRPSLTAGQLTQAIHQQALLTAGMTPAQAIDFLLDTVPASLA